MPKSCSTVCPRPESYDAPRALMSVAPNLCCDETNNRETYTHVTFSFFFSSIVVLNGTSSTLLNKNGKRRCSFLIPNLRGKKITFDHCMLLAMGFYICIFTYRSSFFLFLSVDCFLLCLYYFQFPSTVVV